MGNASLYNKDFLSVLDLDAQLAAEVLDLADQVKEYPSDFTASLLGKVMVMIFEKPSLRTRVTFESGIASLGGKAIYLAPEQIKMGDREPVCDVARNLERWVNVIVARTYSHDTLEELAREGSIPVVNALSDWEHPCQALADFQTVRAHFGNRPITLTYIGDGNNVCHSLILLGVMLGHEMRVACPEGYEPDAKVLGQAAALGNGSAGSVQVGSDVKGLVEGADILYTDVWTSMGQEEEQAKRRADFAGYQINKDLVNLAGSDTKVLHCLPAHRGEEITAEVIDSPASILYEQAENRLHSQKALLLKLLEG